MPDLPGLWSLSPIAGMIGMIVLFYYLLANGRIIPKASHERELKAYATRGDEWKETALLERTVTAKLLEQNKQLIESNKISDHFYKELLPKSVAGINNQGSLADQS